MATNKTTIEHEQKHDHAYRASWHDYKQPAIYLITINTKDRLPILGKLEGERIVLSAQGEQVADEIERIHTYKDASSIQVYRYVVMPNHVHILLRVHRTLRHPIGYYISWFKLQCMERCSVPAGIPVASKPPIFGTDYHDRILTHEGQLENMARYIKDNPHRLALKRANPDLFRIRQQTRIGNIPCTVLGNIFLAEHPQRQALHCSRSLTQEQIETLKTHCLEQASNGTIFISAAISEGEKQICRALREAHVPLVVLLEKGFPASDSPHFAYFKPQGVYFEACSAGKLLLVEPDKETLENPKVAAQVIAKAGDIPHDTLRYRFLALNVLAEEMCR